MSKYFRALVDPKYWKAVAHGVVPAVEHIAAMRLVRAKTLIDVGANKGQFSLVAHQMFPNLEIFAFEPLKLERTIYEKVMPRATKLHSTALGQYQGKAEFFVTSRADSSSLLEAGAGQVSAYGVSPKKSITVDVARLSDVLDLKRIKRPILLKIDVQGGELNVLKGLLDNLPLIDSIYCEASFVELYRGQPLAGEVVKFLDEEGFLLRGVFNCSQTVAFGPTQADFLFQLRTDAVPEQDA